MTKSKFILISLLTLIIVSSVIFISPIQQSISAKIAPHISDQPKVMGVQFSNSPPHWAKDAEAIMRELESWRELNFNQPLKIHIKPKEENEPAGWYVPETKQLIVTSEGSDEFKRGVMLHEIFHALQDQNFDLSLLHQSVQSEDASQALDALIEGEAMLAVKDRLNYNFAAHAQLPKDGSISDELFNRLFEYGDGMAFVKAIRNEGGWEEVNQAFEALPKSTSEIYHPERYLSQLAATKEQSNVSVAVGEYGFRLWMARSPNTRSLLTNLGGAYEKDTFHVSESGEHMWQIYLESEEWAQKIKAMAPEAISMMPQAPKEYEIQQDKNLVTISWQASRPTSLSKLTVPSAKTNQSPSP